MKCRNTIVAVVLSFMITAGLQAWAQDDPYQALRRYDFQERASLAAIQKEIVAARGSAQRLGAIEVKLIGVLSDASATFGGKQEACKLLSSMGSARSVPALQRMLAGDARTADAARYALERIPGPEASAALRSALSTARGAARVGIINSIGVRRDGAAVTALAKLVSSSDSALRAAALEALGAIGTEPALDTLLKARSSARRDGAVSHALLRCASGLARSGKQARAQSVYTLLVCAGQPAYVRVTALRGLAGIGASNAVAVALAGLKDSNAYVRRGAAQVLAESKRADVTAKAIAAFGSASPEAQVVLLTGWATRGEPQAASAALGALSSQDAEVRAAAIRAAARTAGARAVAPLAEIAAQSGNDGNVAREALAGMAGAPTAQAIVRLAREGKPEVRAALMGVLAERPGAASLAALLEGARAESPIVAVAALRGIGAVGGADEAAPVTAILAATTHDEVREAAGRAVVACAQRSGQRDQAVTAIVGALANASSDARITLLGALAEIGGDRALEELKSAAASADPDVRRAAVRGLADTWTDSAPAPLLLNIAQNDASAAVRIIALRGYIRLIAQDGGIPAGAKIEALEQALRAAQRPDEKRQAFGALRDCREERAASALAAYLEDADLAVEAAEAILDLAAPQKRNNRDLPAVKGAAMTAALDAIIQKISDAGIKERAQKLK